MPSVSDTTSFRDFCLKQPMMLDFLRGFHDCDIAELRKFYNVVNRRSYHRDTFAMLLADANDIWT